MTRTAIIAAMPGELKPLTRRWRHERRNGVDLWRWTFDEGEWIAACAGAGVDAAIKALAEAEQFGPLDQVISTGWAGALSAEFLPGQAYDVSAVIDARTGERQLTAGPGQCSLVTSSKVADEQEKRRLAAAYGAGLVDMEASGVARVAAIRGIPFYCIKGVSDGFADKLPDFNRFILPNGQFQLARFVLFAVLRPWHWPALMRMGENSKRASQSIAESLLELLDPQGIIRERNGYPDYKR
jgi:adenosylhomocysteine nucleosidase